jgi:exodeoxyribonuclease-3
MKIYSWNVNGIRASIKKGALQKLVKDINPAVLCIQETKAKQGQAVIDLPKYYESWNDAEKPGYSGTLIFSKDKPIKVIYGFIEGIAQKHNITSDKYGDPTKEGRIISIELEKLWIVTVYVPNSKDDLSRIPLRKEQWDPAVLTHIKELEKTKPVILLGDFNVAHTDIDVANPKTKKGKHGFTVEEKSGFDAFITAGFVDTFREQYPDRVDAYTWWAQWGGARSRNVGWRIDYTLASKILLKNITSSEIHPEILGSDHCPISIELNI